MHLRLLFSQSILPVLAGHATPLPRLLSGGLSAAAGLTAFLWAMPHLLHAEAACRGSQLALGPALIGRRANAHAALIVPRWDGRCDAGLVSSQPSAALVARLRQELRSMPVAQREARQCAPACWPSADWSGTQTHDGTPDPAAPDTLYCRLHELSDSIRDFLRQPL